MGFSPLLVFVRRAYPRAIFAVLFLGFKHKPPVDYRQLGSERPQPDSLPIARNQEAVTRRSDAAIRREGWPRPQRLERPRAAVRCDPGASRRAPSTARRPPSGLQRRLNRGGTARPA